MEQEKRKKRQSIKVITSEIIMFFAVVGLVAVLALVVSGYWLNSDLKVERQGMLQISSVPSGADVEIDGVSSWLQRTNTSKVLSSGEHSIVLTKDGYDTWSKNINISDGLLYRINYPRLFLDNRDSSKVLDITDFQIASFSPDHGKLLLINDTTEWVIVDLRPDKIIQKKLNVANYFSCVSLAEGASKGLFNGDVAKLDWDQDGSHVLVNANYESNTEWALLDVNDTKNSINLTQEFSMNFSDIKSLDNSSSNLVVVQGDSLRKIDLGDKQISAVLASGIVDFDIYNGDILFSAAKNSSESDSDYYLGLIKNNETEATSLMSLSHPAKLIVSRFYEDKYFALLSGNILTTYNFNDFEEIASYEISFAPDNLRVGYGGEFVLATAGDKIATLDLEANAVREWEIEQDIYGWLDNYMIYVVSDGELIVYDFDGYNRRVIAKNVSEHFPVGITENKYLYYFRDGNLIREWLSPR